MVFLNFFGVTASITGAEYEVNIQGGLNSMGLFFRGLEFEFFEVSNLNF